MNAKRKPRHPDFDVRDHAIVRYLERTGQIDVEKLKEEILSDRIVEQARVLGNGHYPIRSGLIAVIKDKNVVTVVVNGGKSH